MIRTLRFLRAYTQPAAAQVSEEEIRFPVADELRDATVFRPAATDGAPLPAWVVLHGLTVPGRQHAALRRFVRAIASSGAVVLVPDVPSWRALHIDSDAARQTIPAAVRHLSGLAGVQRGGVGLVGFSFGATQALIAASDPDIGRLLRVVVGFGGYCELPRMVRAMLIGEHEWNGTVERIDADPYGRWMMIGNFLTRIPRYYAMTRVAEAALELAREAGRRGAFAWDAEYDAFKATLAHEMTAEERQIWSVVAPTAGAPPGDAELARQLADDLAVVALDLDPALEPGDAIAAVTTPTILVHGRDDRLVPYTESLRLATKLQGARPLRVLVTRLFAHSAHGSPLGPPAYAVEAWRFAAALRRMLRA